MSLFDTLASRYDQWCKTPLGHLTDTSERAALVSLLPSSLAGLQTLDVGCGTGTWAVHLAELGASVAAVDLSPAMIGVAEEKARRADRMITFSVADGTALPYAADSFDLVTALLVLEFSSDPGRVVAEMARVLRPGGELVIATLNRRSLWTLQRRLQGRRRPTVYNHARFLIRSELEHLMRHAGLTVTGGSAAVYFPPIAWDAAQPVHRLLEAAGRRGWGAGPAWIAVRASKN